MKQDTGKLLDKARRAIEAARRLLDQGDAEFSAGRAYYAMFYVAEALLHEAGLHASKHSGVHALYGEHFAKTGRLNPRYHRWLLEAFAKRLAGDYEFEATLDVQDAGALIMQAREFVEVAEQLLKRSSSIPDNPEK